MILRIDNSYSRLEGITSSILPKLKEELSYSIDANSAYFSGNYGPRKKYCIDKKGNFPTGLLDKVLNLLNKEKIPHTIVDLRVSPKQRKHINIAKTVIPYKAQIEAAESAIKNKRGCISMPTGTGKSLVIALILARLNVKSLVIVPSLEIKKQLTDSLAFVLSDMSKITVENIDSGSLDKKTDFDCLIIDEAHHVAAKTYQKLNKTAWAGVYYRFFLTATPFRNNKEETILFESIAGQVIYKLDYKQAVKEKYIVPIEAYYIEMPRKETDAYTWLEVYRDLVVNHYEKNAVICNLLQNLRDAGIPTLCLVKEINHGVKLSEESGVLFVNGQDEETRSYIKEFNSRLLTSLIGTSGILGEGIDTRPAEYVIIAGLGKAKSTFMQQVGRVLRNYPGKISGKVILIKDKSHKFTLRHYNAQAKVLLDEYGIKPLKLNI